MVSKVPKRIDVLNLLMPIKNKWYTIGTSLEVNTQDLDSINTSNNSTETNLSTVINKWLEVKSTDATWKGLLKVVEGPNVKNHQIGDHIRTFLKKSIGYSKYIVAGHRTLVSECAILLIYFLCTYNNVHVVISLNIILLYCYIVLLLLYCYCYYIVIHYVQEFEHPSKSLVENKCQS